MEHRSLSRTTLGLLILAACPRALGHVHVVAPVAGPGVDFTDLQSAIDAAAPGDIVLLKDGTYSAGAGTASYDLFGKAITLVAEAGANPLLTSRVFAGQQPSGAIVLRGVDVRAATFDGALFLDGDAAVHVHVEDAEVRAIAGSTSPTLSSAPSGVYVASALELVAVNSRVTGADNPGTFGSPGAGLAQVGSGALGLFGCAFTGGTSGGYGGTLQQAFVYAAGCAFTGGSGQAGMDATGPGPSEACTGGSPGGAGLFVWHAFGGLPKVLLGTALTGGAGGAAGQGQPGCASGPAGPPSVVIGSPPLQILAETPRGLATNTPVREGQTLSLDYTGQPGEYVFVDVGGIADFAYAPAFEGLELIEAPLLLFQGVVPSGGVLHRSVVIADLGPGVEGATVFLQSFHFSPAHGIQAGPPSAVVLLDAAL